MIISKSEARAKHPAGINPKQIQMPEIKIFQTNTVKNILKIW